MHGLLKLSDGFVGFIILLCALKFVIKAKKKISMDKYKKHNGEQNSSRRIYRS